MDRKNREKYWKTHLKYLIILSLIWLVVGLVFPILLVEVLNEVRLAGFPLGFWFSLQGSIVIFIIILFVYAWLMNRLDQKYNRKSE